MKAEGEKYAVKKQSETNGKDEGKNNCFSFAYGTDGYVFVLRYQSLADM
jgi:signal transduction histidine kinase